MEHWLVGGILAALVGLVISWMNHQISLYILKKKPDMVAAMSAPRQIINIVYLFLVYYLAPYTPWSRMAMLVGAAIGMTGSMIYFTGRLLNAIETSKAAQKTEESGGDNNG